MALYATASKHPPYRYLAWCLAIALNACNVNSNPDNAATTGSGAGVESKTQAPLPPVSRDAPQFTGFADIRYFAGGYFDFSWRYLSSYNGIDDPEQTGMVRLEFIDAIDVAFTNLGTLTLYKTRTSTLSGDTFPLGWPAYEYMAAQEGRIYIAYKDAAGDFALSILFDAADGYVDQQGFFGFFAGDRPETVSNNRIQNPFIDHAAVVINEPLKEPRCVSETQQSVCGNQSHDYDVREYYLPNIGFGGFYRAGSSEFTSNGHTDHYASRVEVGLNATNIYDLNALN